MSNPKTVKIILDGTIPSKKNSRVNTRSGRSFPSKKYVQWHNQALLDILRQVGDDERFEKPVEMNIILYFGTKGRADIDNKTSSILDTLTDCGVIRDDDWKCVPKISIEAIYRKGKSGALVEIREIVV